MKLSRTTACAVLALALVATRAPADTVLQGHDLWETDSGTTSDHLSLPPGFFGPGCQPFDGIVALRGEPLDCLGPTCGLKPTDTIVRRLADAGPIFPATIPIEIVALELRSVAPIQVSCPGGTQSWNVSVSITPTNPPQSTGSMTIRHQYAQGGTYDSVLPVRPLLTFTRVDQPQAPISTIPPQPIVLSAAGQPWCHSSNSPLDDPAGDVVLEVPGTTSNFFPGIICPNSPHGGVGVPGQSTKKLTTEDSLLAKHGVKPAEKKPHYKCFKIVGDDPPDIVQLQTQFGVQTGVQVGPAHYVCPPAIKIVNGKEFGDLDIPHLKCFDILGNDPPQIVDLKTQFGVEARVPVGQAKLLCVPALKQLVVPPGPPPVGPLPTSPHYTCYEIGGPSPNVFVDLKTQFGYETHVHVNQPKYLCAPSLKNNQGSLQEPHLKCYDIVGSDPINVVNLQSQFGFEQNVAVGQAQLMCIPVKKKVQTAACCLPGNVCQDTLVGQCAGIPLPKFSSCLDGAVAFGQTVVAVDENTLRWTDPVNVNFAKGQFTLSSDIGQYAAPCQGPVQNATSLSMGADLPAPGHGVYYLLKLSGYCLPGSWQTSLGAEPARDTAIVCPPAQCDCCVPHPNPGCNNAQCQSQVCSFQPICCSQPWSPGCASIALQFCACCH